MDVLGIGEELLCPPQKSSPNLLFSVTCFVLYKNGNSLFVFNHVWVFFLNITFVRFIHIPCTCSSFSLYEYTINRYLCYFQSESHYKRYMHLQPDKIIKNGFPKQLIKFILQSTVYENFHCSTLLTQHVIVRFSVFIN